MIDIGAKIKSYRLKLGLTQEELAARTELSKGFISQLERNQTSPSIATLGDILEALGTDLSAFFTETAPAKVAFAVEDMFVKDDPEKGYSIAWLVPNAQKNAMEPLLLTLAPGGESMQQDPHEGEEFGYVLSGTVQLCLGGKRHRLRRGESFCFQPGGVHYILNSGRSEARVLWVSTPPSF